MLSLKNLHQWAQDMNVHSPGLKRNIYIYTWHALFHICICMLQLTDNRTPVPKHDLNWCLLRVTHATTDTKGLLYCLASNVLPQITNCMQYTEMNVSRYCDHLTNTKWSHNFYFSLNHDFTAKPLKSSLSMYFFFWDILLWLHFKT